MVVSNTVAAFSHISVLKGENILKINYPLAHKLLTAMNEATEWGQTFILDSLVHFQPTNPNEVPEVIFIYIKY